MDYSSPVREEGGYHRFEHNNDQGFNGFDRHNNDHRWDPGFDRRHDAFSHRSNLQTSGSTASNGPRDDACSCLVVVITFCVFGSMSLIFGIYGSENLRVGPNSSLLIHPNPIFIQSIKVEKLDYRDAGMELYGFYETPPLDVVTNWSSIHYLSIPADSYKYWRYYLNEGSQINIEYNVESAGFQIFLIIAQGTEGLSEWVQNPAYPNSTLSWNVVSGSGVIRQDIHQSSSYYVAVGNLDLKEVNVTLNLQFKALLYDTTGAYYKCTFPGGQCSLDVLLPKGNYAVLTSPGPEQNSSNEFSVKLSYGPRWMAYFIGMGGMTALLLAAFNFCTKHHSTREEETTTQQGETGPERAPLVSNKEDDLSSFCSSYGSLLTSTEDMDDTTAGQEGENSRRLCAICFDAPRDCFFLSCGHCVACFQCGTRIAEAAGNCPICRRRIKKVRRIFTV